MITDKQRDAYRRDGCVRIEGAFDSGWVALLTEAFDRNIAKVAAGEDFGPTLLDGAKPGDGDIDEASGRAHLRSVALHDPAIWSWVTDSPAGQLVGEMLGCETVQFWQDTWFSKRAAGNSSATVWHHDAPGLFQGPDYPVTWLALTDVTEKDAPLITYRGSHTDPRQFVPPYRPGREHIPLPEGFYETTAIEAEVAADPSRIQVWTMRAGDCLILHPVTWHASLASQPGGNPRRLAATIRWLGNDVEYRPNPYSEGLGQFPALHDLPVGSRPPYPFMPVIWRRSRSEAA